MTFLNDERNPISLSHQRTFSTQSPLMPRLMNVSKKIFPNVIISRETFHNSVSYYNTINVVMFKMNTVIVVNFKPVISRILLNEIEAITKIPEDYYNTIADIKNNPVSC